MNTVKDYFELVKTLTIIVTCIQILLMITRLTDRFICASSAGICSLMSHNLHTASFFAYRKGKPEGLFRSHRYTQRFFVRFSLVKKKRSCVLLVELRFKSNSLKDNRLKKFMEQQKLKAVLEYLAKHWHEQHKSTSTTAKSVQMKSNQERKQSEQVHEKIETLHFDQPGELKGDGVRDRFQDRIELPFLLFVVTLLPRAIAIRPHILCCILRNIDMATSGNLKKFLNLQVIHQWRSNGGKICVDLEWAARWDLSEKNIGNDCNTWFIINLGQSRVRCTESRRDRSRHGISTINCVVMLNTRERWRDAINSRDCTSKSSISRSFDSCSLRRYSTLLQDQPEFSCLDDQDRHVISLPPLTNAERSKLSNNCESIFVEITSIHSIDTCRRVMDAFLRQVLTNELTKKSSEESVRQVLVLQQTRVVDEKGQLKTTFPSRSNLDWNEIKQVSIVIERFNVDK